MGDRRSFGTPLRDDQRRTPDWIRARVTVDAQTGCWNWSGRISPNGYGCVSVSKTTTRAAWAMGAHRISYVAFVRDLEQGEAIDHLCRNRACVNPDHLEAVRQSTNVLRGRWSDGNPIATHCRHGHAKTPNNVYVCPRGWRECLTCRRASQSALAARQRAAV
jgi:hypothetical protein